MIQRNLSACIVCDFADTLVFFQLRNASILDTFVLLTPLLKQHNKPALMATIVREYRIVMPLRIEEYDIGQLYTVVEMTKEDTSTKIQVLENKAYTHATMGDCQKTLKVMHLDNYVPSLVKKMVSKAALKIHETSYNAYPVCYTFYHSPMLDTKTFSMSVNSIHIEKPVNENVFKLSPEERGKVEVVYINIDENIGNKKYDPTNFDNTKSGKILLKKGWQDECERKSISVMICYKLVKIEVNFFSGSWVAEKILKEFVKLLRNAHQRIYSTCDQWTGLQRSDIRVMERDAFSLAEPEHLQGNEECAVNVPVD